MNGLILVDKPIGWTSFDVVNKLRQVIKATGVKSNRKRYPVGHSGTLDPLASGLLIVLVGAYTKLADQFLGLDKTYLVKSRLGWISSTGDGEGEKSHISDKKPSNDLVDQTLRSIIGSYNQIPPAFSAIKINGQRAYSLARSGKVLDLRPRPVTIYEIDQLDYSYPTVSFRTRVSSGTYVRSLVEDMGDKLKTGAYTTSLRRTQIGTYSIKEAVSVEKIDSTNIAKLVIEQD